MLLRGITLWTMWVERNDTFDNNRWDTIKMLIWQSLLEYAIIASHIVRKNANMVAIYDDALGNHEKKSWEETDFSTTYITLERCVETEERLMWA